MRNSIARMLVLLASAVIGTSVASAASNAVIIQAWLPSEGAGLDWVTGNPDTADELWNDCSLVITGHSGSALLGSRSQQ